MMIDHRGQILKHSKGGLAKPVLQSPLGNVIRVKSFTNFAKSLKEQVISVSPGLQGNSWTQEYMKTYPSQYWKDDSLGEISMDDCIDKVSYLLYNNLDEHREDFANNKKDTHILSIENIFKTCWKRMANYRQEPDTLVWLDHGMFALVDSSDWKLYRTPLHEFWVWKDNQPVKITGVRMSIVPNKLTPLDIFVRM